MHSLSLSHCSTPSTPQLARYGKLAAGLSSADSLYVPHKLDTGPATLDTLARINRGLQPSCNSAPSIPRPFSPDSSSGSAAAKHSGRENVAGRVGKSKGVKIVLSEEEQKSASKSSRAALSVMRTIFPDVEGACMPICLSPAHSPGAVFLPATAVDGPFPECLRLVGDRVSISSVFRMALTCCVVAQWMKIAGRLTLWASRLRLRFFESPLVYKNSTKSSKLGRIGVFWDLENSPVPSGCDIPTVIDKVRAIGNAFGEIQCFRAYGKLEYLTRQALPFLNKDVELCPVPDGKEAADKAIILDASLFAFDHKPCTEDSKDSEIQNDVIVIVTGDRGFAALLKGLSKRNITTIVIGNAHQPLPSILCQSADFALGWDDMMIMNDFNNDLFELSSEAFALPNIQKVQTRELALVTKIFYGDLSDPEADSRSTELQGSSNVDCYQLDSSGSELLCTTSSEQPNPLVHGLTKNFSHSATEGAKEDGMKQQLQRRDCNSCETADGSKFTVPIGGKVRVLRHLRHEIAAIAEKYCNKGVHINLQEFMRLYEMEMGHSLIPGHYGCGGLKTLLESMPDIVSLRSCSSSEVEIFPFYPKGKRSYGKINYSREDLRCILYEVLRITWPHGVRKDHLSSEHLRVTGRPFVLVNYEFLKMGDVFVSMRDIVYVDPRTKQLHLVDGAQEPACYRTFAQNRWS